MWTRSILTVAAIVAAGSAAGVELRPEEAKHFITGKQFSYTCFDGTNGAGRVNADGSVVGNIQIRGTGPVRFVSLPVGTIRVQPDSICASLRGLPFQPCFAVNQTDARSFRGSLAGFRFAYCDFTRHNPRLDIQATSPPPEPSDLTRASVKD
jgi:hypothetical protein